MFNVDGKEFITLVLVALVVLGPEKLPEVFRRAGRLYSEVKRMSDGFQAEFQRAIEEPMKQVDETRSLVRESVDFRPTFDDDSDGADDVEEAPDGVDGSEVSGGFAGPEDADDSVDDGQVSDPSSGRAGDAPVEIDKDQAEVERRIAEMENVAGRLDVAEEAEEG